MWNKDINPDNMPFKGWYDKDTGLFWSVLTTNAQTILEIGVGAGVSTLALTMGASLTNGHVWSVDIRPCWRAKGRIESKGLTDYWTFIQSDSKEYEWDNGDIDILFIDGEHSYKHVKSDLTKFGEFAKVILMHDTDPHSKQPGVPKACKEYSDKFVYYPVYDGLGILNNE